MSFLPTDRVMLRALRASKIRGVQLAIVVDNKDGEGNPGYRVKVEFPWLNEQETSFWARIAVPMGGSGRGTYVLPEIDDQVLVVFEHGDINRPIVVGSLWSKKQEPVEVNQSGKNNTKLIKSRAGHRIIFDDKEGAEKIVIVDQTKKNKIILDSVNKIVKIESDGDIEIKAKTNIILHSNALKVGTKEGITGKARSLLTHAQKTFGLKATGGITIGGGNTTINVSNAAATSVSGSGSGELGGAAAEPAKDQRTVADLNARAGGGGSGGAGGAAQRGTSGGDQQASSSGTSGASGAAPKDHTDWLAIELVDKDDKPVPMIRYKVVGPDGVEHTGLTDPDGRARIEGLSPGDCAVTFPDLHVGEWERA
jgi:phage baseplate assembly protein gpV